MRMEPMSLCGRRAHYLVVYGQRRLAEMQVRTAVGARFMVRMCSSLASNPLACRSNVVRCVMRSDPVGGHG
jgi:hypothetical protein